MQQNTEVHQLGKNRGKVLEEGAAFICKDMIMHAEHINHHLHLHHLHCE